MSAWHIAVRIEGNARTLVIDADSAPAALEQLEQHRAASNTDRSLVRSYPTADGDRIHVRWGVVSILEVGPVTPG